MTPRRGSPLISAGTGLGVTALLATPADGTVRIISACSDGTVEVWEPAATEPSVTYQEHRGAVRALRTVRLSGAAPGSFVVSAGKEADLRVWRPETGETLRVVPSGHSEVTALAEIPGHPSWLVSGGPDGAVLLHDLLASGRGPVTWDSHPRGQAVRALAVVARDASITIVSAHADGTVRFRDAATPASPAGEAHWRAAHGGEARALAAGTAGGRAVIFSGGDDHLIKVWDAEHKAADPDAPSGAGSGPLPSPNSCWTRAVPPSGQSCPAVMTTPSRSVTSPAAPGGCCRHITAACGRWPCRPEMCRPLHQAVWTTVCKCGICPERCAAPLSGHGDWVRALDIGTLPGGERSSFGQRGR